MKIETAVSEFLATLTSEGRSPHTVNAYRRDLATFVRYAGDTVIEEVTPSLLTAFMAHDSVQLRLCGARRAKSTVNRYRVALKALFAWASDRWLIQRNPTAILKCRRHRGLPPVVLTEEEVEHIVRFQFTGRHAARDHALLMFLLQTGCRLGETVALDVGDVNLDAGTAVLRSPKGGDPDRIFISTAIIDSLTSVVERSAPERPLWSTSGGTRLSSRQVQRIVARRAAESGITKQVTPHTLRHSFATHLYNRTADIRLVQQALRHGHVTTTETYAQVDPRRWRKAVEISRASL